MTHITLTTKFGDIFQLPEIGELSSYLIYCLKKDIWLDEHVKAIREKPLTAAKGDQLVTGRDSEGHEFSPG